MTRITIGGRAKEDDVCHSISGGENGEQRRAITKVRHDDLPSAEVWHDDPPSLEHRRAITKVRHGDLPSAEVWHDDPPSLEQKYTTAEVDHDDQHL